MALRLIKKDEKFEVEVSGATFVLRRVPDDIKKGLLKKHSKKGQLDMASTIDFTNDLLAYAILDWKGVIDDDGNEIPYNRDLVKYLPENAKAELVNILQENDPLEVAKQNL